MFGQNRVIFVTVSRAISFHQWFMQGCDCNCCTFSLRGRGVGVRQISSLEAYRLTLPPPPAPPSSPQVGFNQGQVKLLFVC